MDYSAVKKTNHKTNSLFLNCTNLLGTTGWKYRAV